MKCSKRKNIIKLILLVPSALLILVTDALVTVMLLAMNVSGGYPLALEEAIILLSPSIIVAACVMNIILSVQYNVGKVDGKKLCYSSVACSAISIIAWKYYLIHWIGEAYGFVPILYKLCTVVFIFVFLISVWQLIEYKCFAEKVCGVQEAVPSECDMDEIK